MMGATASSTPAASTRGVPACRGRIERSATWAVRMPWEGERARRMPAGTPIVRAWLNRADMEGMGFRSREKGRWGGDKPRPELLPQQQVGNILYLWQQISMGSGKRRGDPLRRRFESLGAPGRRHETQD